MARGFSFPQAPFLGAPQHNALQRNMGAAWTEAAAGDKLALGLGFRKNIP
jgi:hypothetical protein